ncbi:MAG: hypothetical protein J6P47_05405 [Acetobacter sp.]|nr:hypothetical protein [Acetobacter sp.]MBO6086568.1 hypothetical protein [Acetobacter sp.]MBO7350894.1 hypothetical protein [Acetobacter sp.]MBQ5546526.1 hypothetical protein [Acetobacter sp.]
MSSRCLITFDLNTNELEEYVTNNKEQLGYGSISNCYLIILKVLEGHGFERIQRSVYFGYEGTTQAHGTIALQKLAIANPWFIDPYVTDIRFLEVTGDYNAQFIIEEVAQARKAYELLKERNKLLRKNLLARGLTPSEIDELIGIEQPALSVENISSFSQAALPKADKK